MARRSSSAQRRRPIRRSATTVSAAPLSEVRSCTRNHSSTSTMSAVFAVGVKPSTRWWGSQPSPGSADRWTTPMRSSRRRATAATTPTSGHTPPPSSIPAPGTPTSACRTVPAQKLPVRVHVARRATVRRWSRLPAVSGSAPASSWTETAPASSTVTSLRSAWASTTRSPSPTAATEGRRARSWRPAAGRPRLVGSATRPSRRPPLRPPTGPPSRRAAHRRRGSAHPDGQCQRSGRRITPTLDQSDVRSTCTATRR